MDPRELQEHRDRLYRTIVQSTMFTTQFRTFNTHLSDSKTNQQLQVTQDGGVHILFGMLKIYWGTQKVIHLKQEELSWKRRSTRIAYENGLDENLLSAMRSGGENRRPSAKLEHIEEAGSRLNSLPHNVASSMGMYRGRGLALAAMARDEATDMEGHMEEEDGDIVIDTVQMRMGQYSTLPRKCNLQRRTMSFSGHLYNSKTAVFRPKYGTISNVRVSSKQTTNEVISLLLNKFAVENNVEEFNLYSVSHNGETHAFHLNDFPLLKRVQLGPNENVAKIFIRERKSDEISPEVAGFMNLRLPELEAILRKFKEEEEKEVMKIKQRYVQYKANLTKKLAILTAEIEKESKSKAKRNRKDKKKGKGKDKAKGKKK